MRQSRFPPGWDEERVQRVLTHYESQSEEEAVAEDQAAYTATETFEELSGNLRRLTAVYEIRLQRKLFVTRPLQEKISDLHFSATVNSSRTEVTLVVDELPRQESPNRGIVICQVSRIEIRVARLESTDLPHLVPPNEQGPQYLAWSEAYRARLDECTNAALVAVNRLLAFFKYGLRYPLLEPFAFLDLLPPKWLDEHGAEIKTPFQHISATWSRPAYLENTLQPHDDERLRFFLETDIQPSLAEEILLDSLGAVEEKNLRRAIIEAAVCCEVATKQTITYEYLDATDNTRTSVIELLDRTFGEIFDASFKQSDPKRYQDIDHLFRARNKAAHRAAISFRDDGGAEHIVTRQMVAEWLISAQVLLNWLSQFRQTAEEYAEAEG